MAKLPIETTQEIRETLNLMSKILNDLYIEVKNAKIMLSHVPQEELKRTQEIARCENMLRGFVTAREIVFDILDEKENNNA